MKFSLFKIAIVASSVVLGVTQVSSADPECSLDSDCPLNNDPFCSAECIDGTCIGVCSGMTVLPPPPTASPVSSVECKAPSDCTPIDDPLCSTDCIAGSCMIMCANQPLPPPPECVAKVDCAQPSDSSCASDCLDGKCMVMCINQPAPTTCKLTSDCAKGQFCAAGTCIDHGTCTRALDCDNPDNVFTSNQCDGFFRCDAGKCARRCRDTGCPVDKLPVTCDVDPCQAKADECKADYVSCVSNNCGGCNAVFFNASGKRVCWKGNRSVTTKCKKSSDCDDGHFCSKKKKCIKHGHCFGTRDCHDKDNVAPDNMCPSKDDGWLHCKANRCEWKC